SHYPVEERDGRTSRVVERIRSHTHRPRPHQQCCGLRICRNSRPGLKTRPTCVTQMGSGAGFEWVLFDQVRCDEGASDQVLLNDPLEHRRIARTVPGALGIDDGDRAAFADPQAVRLRTQDSSLLRQPELLQPPLQKLPCCEPAVLLATLRGRLVAAEKDVAPRDRHTDALSDLL